jgi:hypothetical protein
LVQSFICLFKHRNCNLHHLELHFCVLNLLPQISCLLD